MKVFSIIFLVFTSIQVQAQRCWKMTSAGADFSSGITIDGKLWAWGNNNFSQLGIAAGNTLSPAQVGLSSDWVAVSSGTAHGLALKANGTLWAWGDNYYGQLGNGTNSSQQTPVQVSIATNWKSIDAGGSHCFAFKTDGTLWAWGANYSGKLGDGTTNMQLSPVQIGTANEWKCVSAGADHSLGIKMNGTLWAWGRNEYGQLGTGDFAEHNIPTQVGTATDWDTISSGAWFSVGIKTNGSLWTWGRNASSELGDGTNINKGSPVQIPGVWKYAGAAHMSTGAIKSDGSFWAWGANWHGQLGTTAFSESNVPVLVGTNNNWESVTGGFMHFMAMSNGNLYTLGGNVWGVLGDGTTTNNSNATMVECPANTSNVENISGLGSAEFSSSKTPFTIYPNPSNSYFEIEVLQTSNDLTEKARLLNLIGDEIRTINLMQNKTHVDISELEKGIYFVELTYNGTKVIKKIIKE